MYPPARRKQDPMARALVERTQSLTGTRSSAAPEKKAVTREDAANRGIVKLKATRTTATPTMDQYNAMLEDMHQIALALNAMGAKFSLP